MRNQNNLNDTCSTHSLSFKCVLNVLQLLEQQLEEETF